MNPSQPPCSKIRSQFSSYLDGDISGIAMQQIAAHLRDCSACREDFESLRANQSVLSALGPIKPPPDLALRLRVAVSRERARTPRNLLSLLKVRWQNTIAPLLLQASAGFASTILLVGSVALLIGTFATPEPLAARMNPWAWRRAHAFFILLPKLKRPPSVAAIHPWSSRPMLMILERFTITTSSPARATQGPVRKLKIRCYLVFSSPPNPSASRSEG